MLSLTLSSLSYSYCPFFSFFVWVNSLLYPYPPKARRHHSPTMKPTTTTTLLSFLPLFLPVFSTPVSTRNYGNPKLPARLSGSSFGVPGPQTFDYVIIGGGTAGLALASRLSENPNWTVAVVEAGGFYETDNGNVSQVPLFASIGSDKTAANYNPLVDWGFMTEPQTVGYPF